ncbi:Non-histone chromosomal protein 6 [Tulasnella sp. 332]|nr:Non-histone chromosomal protein 6 [Tulasnella sp. 332]
MADSSPQRYNPMTDSPEKTLVDFVDMDVDATPDSCINFTGSFPPEVWIMILESAAMVDSLDTMCRIALTSWSLNRIITPLLWRHVSLHRPRVYNFASPPGPKRSRQLAHRASACARAIKKSHALAACVTTFTLKGWFVKECGTDSPDWEVVQEMNLTFDHLISAVLRCPNLRELDLQDTQIPPRLHRALYHLHSMRSLSLSGCILACRHETCAMNPSRLPITHLTLQNTTQSVHGYNHHFNTIRALAQASTLTTLTIDASVFPDIMDMFITCGIQQSLTTLHATSYGADTDCELFVTFAGLPGNPLRHLSMKEEKLHGDLPWLETAPTALPHLKSLAGGTALLIALTEERRKLESLTFFEMPLLETTSHMDLLKHVAERNRGTLKKLVYPMARLQHSELSVIARMLPDLEELSIEYRKLESCGGFWAQDGIPVVKQFPKLRRLILIRKGQSVLLDLQSGQEMPLKMLGEAGPLAWEAVCPDLCRITLTEKWSWRRLYPRLWAREVLNDDEWRANRPLANEKPSFDALKRMAKSNTCPGSHKSVPPTDPRWGTMGIRLSSTSPNNPYRSVTVWDDDDDHTASARRMPREAKPKVSVIYLATDHYLVPLYGVLRTDRPSSSILCLVAVIDTESRKATEKAAAGKAKRAPKDKSGPKRPMSAFMYFCKDWRERVKAENPEASFGETGKLLGAKWKELDESEKTNYLEQAATDKQRYESEKAASGDGEPAPEKKSRAKKAPKPAASEDDEDDE